LNDDAATYWTLSYILRSPAALAAVVKELHDVLGARVSIALIALCLLFATLITGIIHSLAVCDTLFTTFYGMFYVLILRFIHQANDPNIVLQVEDMHRLEVIDSCISEALRLSSGSLIMREVLEPCTLTLASGNTYSFRKGDNVGIFPPLVHRDTRIYSQPEEFQHDRFLNAPSSYCINGGTVQANICLLPFGGGVSYCPGRKFARNEIKTFVAQLFLRFTVTFEDEADAAKPVEMDYSRAGLGIFLPKNCDTRVKLARIM
jgi:cytochrome P450